MYVTEWGLLPVWMCVCLFLFACRLIIACVCQCVLSCMLYIDYALKLFTARICSFRMQSSVSNYGSVHMNLEALHLGPSRSSNAALAVVVRRSDLSWSSIFLGSLPSNGSALLLFIIFKRVRWTSKFAPAFFLKPLASRCDCLWILEWRSAWVKDALIDNWCTKFV